MPALFTLRDYSSAELRVQPRFETLQATWWLVRTEAASGGVATAHLVVFGPGEGETMKGLFATNGVWEALALGRFVTDVCRELFGEERDVDMTVFGMVPGDALQGVFEWPGDGQQAFLE